MQKLMEEMEKTRLHMEQQGLWKHGAFGNPDMVKFADKSEPALHPNINTKQDVQRAAAELQPKVTALSKRGPSAPVIRPGETAVDAAKRILPRPRYSKAPAASPKEQSGNSGNTPSLLGGMGSAAHKRRTPVRKSLTNAAGPGNSINPVPTTDTPYDERAELQKEYRLWTGGSVLPSYYERADSNVEYPGPVYRNTRDGSIVTADQIYNESRTRSILNRDSASEDNSNGVGYVDPDILKKVGPSMEGTEVGPRDGTPTRTTRPDRRTVYDDIDGARDPYAITKAPQKEPMREIPGFEAANGIPDQITLVDEPSGWYPANTPVAPAQSSGWEVVSSGPAAGGTSTPPVEETTAPSQQNNERTAIAASNLSNGLFWSGLTTDPQGLPIDGSPKWNVGDSGELTLTVDTNRGNRSIPESQLSRLINKSNYDAFADKEILNMTIPDTDNYSPLYPSGGSLRIAFEGRTPYKYVTTTDESSGNLKTLRQNLTTGRVDVDENGDGNYDRSGLNARDGVLIDRDGSDDVNTAYKNITGTDIPEGYGAVPSADGTSEPRFVNLSTGVSYTANQVQEMQVQDLAGLLPVGWSLDPNGWSLDPEKKTPYGPHVRPRGDSIYNDLDWRGSRETGSEPANGIPDSIELEEVPDSIDLGPLDDGTSSPLAGSTLYGPAASGDWGNPYITQKNDQLVHPGDFPVYRLPKPSADLITKFQTAGLNPSTSEAPKLTYKTDGSMQFRFNSADGKQQVVTEQQLARYGKQFAGQTLYTAPVKGNGMPLSPSQGTVTFKFEGEVPYKEITTKNLNGTPHTIRKNLATGTLEISDGTGGPTRSVLNESDGVITSGSDYDAFVEAYKTRYGTILPYGVGVSQSSLRRGDRQARCYVDQFSGKTLTTQDLTALGKQRPTVDQVHTSPTTSVSFATDDKKAPTKLFFRMTALPDQPGMVRVTLGRMLDDGQIQDVKFNKADYKDYSRKEMAAKVPGMAKHYMWQNIPVGSNLLTIADSDKLKGIELGLNEQNQEQMFLIQADGKKVPLPSDSRLGAYAAGRYANRPLDAGYVVTDPATGQLTQIVRNPNGSYSPARRVQPQPLNTSSPQMTAGYDTSTLPQGTQVVSQQGAPEAPQKETLPPPNMDEQTKNEYWNLVWKCVAGGLTIGAAIGLVNSMMSGEKGSTMPSLLAGAGGGALLGGLGAHFGLFGGNGETGNNAVSDDGSNVTNS